MTRTEHLQWCKDRAIEYLDRGDTKNAFASMLSDLKKNPETAGHIGCKLGMLLSMSGNLTDINDMRNFINGFN